MPVKTKTRSVCDWSSWPAALDRVLADHVEAADRAAGIARALHEMAPATEVTGCSLTASEDDALVIEPSDPTIVREVQSQLAAIPAEQLAVSNLRFHPSLTKHKGCATRIACGSRQWGWLILSSAGRAAPGPMLGLAANVLALRLELDEAETLRQAIRADHEAAVELMTSGEAMSGLVHELNNSLNSMLLQAAVVQLSVEPALREEVAAIRSEGACAAARLGWIQRQRERCRLARGRVDLHRAVRDALAECPALAKRIKLEATRGAAFVAANPAAVRRLLACLFRVIEGIQTEKEGELQVRTAEANGQQSLFLRGAPWGSAEGHPRDLLDVEGDDLATEQVLQRLATRSLARLADATIDGSVDGDGGVSAALTWSAAADGEFRQKLPARSL